MDVAELRRLIDGLGDLGNKPFLLRLATADRHVVSYKIRSVALGWFRIVEEAGRKGNQCGVLPKHRHVAGGHAGWSDGLPF